MLENSWEITEKHWQLAWVGYTLDQLTGVKGAEIWCNMEALSELCGFSKGIKAFPTEGRNTREIQQQQQFYDTVYIYVKNDHFFIMD